MVLSCSCQNDLNLESNDEAELKRKKKNDSNIIFCYKIIYLES